MADKTWVGGTSDDAAVDANWSPSGVPATNDKVAIPDASTTSNDCRLTAATSWGTLTIATDGILVGNGQTLTLNGGVNDGGTAADFNYTDAGQTSNVSGNLDITMRNLRSSGDRAIITAAANNIRNLKIDDFTADGGGTGKVYHFQSHLTISGNLTVEYGELNTAFSSTSYNVTVAGTTTIGPASGAADQATLTCNASTVSLGALRQQADYAVNIEVGGTFVGGTGTHTFGSLFMAQSANAKATMTTGQVKVNGENTSANKAWRVEYGGDTFDNANGTVMFQFNGFDSRMSMRSASHANNAFHNLIIHMNGDTRTLGIDNGSKLIVDNDLTITRGVLQMNTNHELEVVGNVVIDDGSDVAKLQMGNVSTASSHPATFGSLTIGNDGTYFATSGTTTILGSSGGFALLDEGTFTHNSGTVKIDFETSNLNSSTRIHQNGAKKLNNVEIEMNRTTDEVTWSVASGTSQGIAGNLTLTKGESYLYSLAHDFDVDGDFLVGANGTWGSLGHSGAHEYGSLGIDTGGTFIATSGTTTLTDKISSGTYTNYMFHNGGTFTHNKGTVHWKADTSSGTWYAMNGSTSATQTEFYNISTERVRASGTEQYRFWTGGSGRHLTVLNNIDIGANTRIFSSNGSGNFRNDGICDISGILNIVNVTTVNMGAVTIESGGELEFGDGNSVNVEGVRNVGGTVTVT